MSTVGGRPYDLSSRPAIVFDVRMLKEGTKPAATARSAFPFSKMPPSVEILKGQNLDDKEDLEQLSFWAISQLEILRGLNKEQKQQIGSLNKKIPLLDSTR